MTTLAPMDLSPTQTQPEPAPELARTLAPDDVRVGDYVALAEAETQVFPVSALDDVQTPERYDRVAFIPQDAGRPRKVVAVALPFVLVREPTGKHVTLDLRLVRLFGLPAAYGKLATERIAPAKNNGKAGGKKANAEKRKAKRGGKGKAKGKGKGKGKGRDRDAS
ncbi:MAG: hypothetical protein AAF916_12090 [Planctomycetota bacterium]